METIDCMSCKQNTYNHGTSIAFRQLSNAEYNPNECKSTISFSSAKLTGCYVRDQVFFDPLKWFGVLDFEWFAIVEQNGIVRSSINLKLVG